MVADGPWEYNTGTTAGVVRSGHRIYQIYWQAFSANPEPNCFDAEPSIVQFSRSRDVSCNPPYDGYQATSNGCESDTKRKLRYTALTCSADKGADPRRGNPCDASTGDKIETEVDYEASGLKLVRTYHSFVQVGAGDFGTGWTHNYSTRVALVGNVPKVVMEGIGYSQPLKLIPGTTSYLSTTGSGDQVRQSGTEWILFRSSGSQETFDATGRLKNTKTPNGLVVELNYGSDGRLEQVVGPFGHRLAFEYDALREFITTVIDPSGQELDYTYENRNLKSVTYQDGKSKQYLYEEQAFPHALTGIIDENASRYSTYDYDAKGRAILSEHAGSIGEITLAYDEVAGTTTVTDANSQQEIFLFTPNPNQWQWRIGTASNTYDSMEAAIIAARSCPDSNGNNYCWNLQAGTITNFVPATTGGAEHRKLISATVGGIGSTYGYTTDPARRPDTVTDANGNVTKYGYDTYHRLTATEAYQDPTYQRTTETAYLEPTSDLPLSVTTPSVIGGGHTQAVTTTYVAGTRRVNTVTVSGYDPAQPGTLLERTTTYSNYDSYALAPKTIDGPRTDVTDTTTLTYWDESSPGVLCTTTGGGACGQPKSLTNALGQVTTYDLYYPDGRLKQMTDPDGVVTVYTYDLRGRLDTVTATPSAGAARVTDYDYDAAGQLSKVTFPNGQILNYVWTPAHLLDYVTDNAGNKVDVSHDSRGNPTGRARQNSAGTTLYSEALSYDIRNYPDTRQVGSRPAADLTYDATGMLQGETDSGGRFTDYNYDPLNRLKELIDPENGTGAPTEYHYNVHDELISVETPNGATTSYVYDDLGNLRKEVSPDRGTTLYGYDAAGNMTCRADGRYTGGGATCEAVLARWVYQYDALNRLTSIDYLANSNSPDVSFQYDTRPGSSVTQPGRLRQVVQVKGAMTVTRQMDYDPWGNVTWSQQEITEGANTATYATSYEYDGKDQLTRITYPSGRVVDYERWPQGPIKKVTATFNGTATTVIAQANYQPFGPPLALGYGNGMTQARVTDTAGSPRESDLVDVTTYSAYDSLGYTVDDAGDITAIDDWLNPAYSRSYAYDDLDRLIWDSGATPASPTYSYDGNGNRLTRAAGTYAAQSFSYNPGSNRQAGTSYDGMGNDLTNAGYDDSGRLSTATLPNSDTLGLYYNGYGELARTRLTHLDNCNNEILLAREDFTFTPDGRALSVRTMNTVAVNVDYIWLDNLPVAQFQDSYDSTGTYIATETTYLHPDYLGTPRIGTDAARNITWRYRSDAFGIAALSGTATVRLRFPGQLNLGAEGFNYNYFRDYDANTGRYLQSDPIGLAGGLNTYGYVGQNPLFWSDPLGLDATICLYPGARGFGHVGYGVNSSETYGFYPEGVDEGNPITGTPGIVKKDTKTPDSCKTISTTAEQDKTLLDFLKGSKVPPFPDYMLTRNNCVDFVRQALDQAGIVTPETIRPKPFFENLPGVAVPSP